MPLPEKLRFRARGSALVTDYEKQEEGVRCYVGRTLNREIGPEFKDLSTRGRPTRRHAVFEPNEEHDERPAHVQHAHLYAAEVRAGNLWAADKVTADFCGVEFDPEFGGELAQEKAARSARQAAAAPTPSKPTTPAAAASSAPKGA
jgi:hypothetical protein